MSDQYLLVTKNQGGRAIPNSPGNTLSISDDSQLLLQTWWREQKKRGGGIIKKEIKYLYTYI